MTIQRSDLKIFKPERLGNETFAGGFRTNNEVVSGKLNDVFSSISDIDYARSAFDLVKLFPAVNTADSSRLQDGYVYIAELPSDALVDTLLVESSNLNDASELSDMHALIVDPYTKFHGTALTTAEITSNKVSVTNTSKRLVPSIEKVNASFGINGYIAEAGSNTVKTASVSFTAPNNANVSFFSLSAPDYIDKDFPLSAWVESSHYNDNKKWQAEYYGKGQYTQTVYLDSADPDDASQVSYVNGDFVVQLTKPLLAGNTFTLKYKSTNDYRFHQFAVNSTLTLAVGETIVPGSYRIKKTGESTVYTDDGNGLFVDSTGSVFAQIDYNTGTITPSAAVDYTSTIAEDLGCTIFMSNAQNQAYPLSISFYIALSSGSHIDFDSVYLKITLADGSKISVASVKTNGSLGGYYGFYGAFSHTYIASGSVNNEGLVRLTMNSGVKVARIDYDFTANTSIATQSNWYGFDVQALPDNADVPIFYRANVVAIANTQRTDQATLTSGQTLTVLVDADFVDIMDSNGASLYSVLDDNYSYDKATGVITINAGVSNFTGPYVITAVQSERALVADIIGNDLTLLTPVTRTYPIGSSVSSVQVLGDMQSLVKDERTATTYFDSSTQKYDFDYNLDGSKSSATGNINTVQYPIEVNNIGAINEKWAIVFTSNTAFKVIGEGVGTIYNGDTTVDLAPSNGLVNAPFFTIRQAAFGAGLNPGEVFLFTTLGASKPIMLSRSVSPGHSNITTDQSTLAFFGNSD